MSNPFNRSFMKSCVICLSVLCILFFSSCDKDSPEKAEYPIVGLWIGTYNATAGEDIVDSLYYSYNIKADSTIQMQGLGADGNTYYGTGTWSLAGNNFSTTITTSNLSQTGVVQKATAIYDKYQGTLSGELTTPGVTFQATFQLSRIN